jgi:hypothetical protein
MCVVLAAGPCSRDDDSAEFPRLRARPEESSTIDGKTGCGSVPRVSSWAIVCVARANALLKLPMQAANVVANVTHGAGNQSTLSCGYAPRMTRSSRAGYLGFRCRL